MLLSSAKGQLKAALKLVSLNHLNMFQGFLSWGFYTAALCLILLHVMGKCGAQELALLWTDFQECFHFHLSWVSHLGTREGACLPLLECVLVSCLASCPPGIRLVPFPEAVLPQPLLPWRLITSGHCRGAEMQLLLCLQFPSSCFHQHFYGLNPALMNSIFSTLTAQCPPRHTFSDVMLCDPTKAVSLLLWYLLIAEIEHFELFLPSVCCIRLLLAFTCYVRSQEICIFPRGEAVLCPWDPAWDTCNSSMIRNPV